MKSILVTPGAARIGPLEHPVRGIALRIGAASAYGIMAALLKLASNRGVAASEMLFYRAIFGLPVILGWVMIGPGLGTLATSRPLAHFGRSALGVASILCTFKALTLLPLADATTISFTAPLFATILAALILAEPVGWHRWAAVAVGFLGMLIVVQPGGHGALPANSAAIALLAAFGTASVTITVRKMGATEHIAAIVFWFFMLSAVFGALLLLIAGRRHPPEVYAILAVAGMMGAAMQLMMTGSLRFAPVAVVAPFDYLQLLWAVGLGWLLFASIPTAPTLIGAAMIAASGLYTVWREQRRRRGMVPVLPPVV